MATFTGDDSPNIFTGGADADTAYGNGGADQLSGNGHNDILYGGAGADVLDGGADDDILISFDASNVYYSYSEMVSLDVGTEHDVLVGGAGNDRLVAGYGDDVSGGTGENNLYINFLGATSGVYADFRAQLMGGSIVVGGGTITGITSTVNIQGSNYDDTLYSVGQYSFSNVYGNGGNDHIVGDYYSWILSGGEGNDVVDGRLSQYLHDVDGGAGDDILYGAYGSSDAHGGEGNDTIYAYGFTYGGAGNDLIVLQQGASSGVVYGEEGDDDISAAQFYGAMLAGGAGADVLRGNSGNDKLVSGGFRPNAYYVPADDMGLEVDTLTGGEGDDTLAIGYGDNADGGFGSDTLWLSLGGLGAGAVFSTAGIVSGQPFVLGGGTIQNVETLTYLRGTNFNDNLTIATQVTLLTIDSGEGDDVVTSASSSVALSGGNGNDRFNSGIAGDTFDGGAGSDTAAYGSAAAGITITLAPDGQTTAGPGGDQLINVENIEGSDYADSITGNAIANALGGGGGDDTLTGLAGNDLLDGGTGADLLRGGADNDIYVVDNAADVVEENSGEGTDEVRTSLASASLASYANVENLTGTSATGQSLTGNAGNNVITGGGGNDFLWLLAGGNDTAIGGLGNDVFLFGATMDGLDAVDGGGGGDQIALQGGVAFTFGTGVVGVESIGLLAGNDTRFGDPGTNFYSYDLTTRDVNVAAGAMLTVDGAKLRAGENLTFNGSAETDGSFFIYGGRGVDTLTGGSKNDTFLFGSDNHFGASDTVNGGAGIDQLALRGSYSLTFGAGQLVGIESIGLLSAQDTRYGALGTSYSYNLTMNDGNVAAGVQMVVDGAKLRGGETLVFNGSAESDGSFQIFGGANGDTITGSQNADVLQGNAGADILTGGGGADSFRYKLVTDSSASATDHILDFASGTDRIDLSKIDANTGLAGDQAFGWIGSGAFTSVAGQLRVYQSGNDWFVEGDVNGDGAADLVIQVTVTGGPLVQGDFLP